MACWTGNEHEQFKLFLYVRSRLKVKSTTINFDWMCQITYVVIRIINNWRNSGKITFSKKVIQTSLEKRDPL